MGNSKSRSKSKILPESIRKSERGSTIHDVEELRLETLPLPKRTVPHPLKLDTEDLSKIIFGQTTIEDKKNALFTLYKHYVTLNGGAVGDIHNPRTFFIYLAIVLGMKSKNINDIEISLVLDELWLTRDVECDDQLV